MIEHQLRPDWKIVPTLVDDQFAAMIPKACKAAFVHTDRTGCLRQLFPVVYQVESVHREVRVSVVEILQVRSPHEFAGRWGAGQTNDPHKPVARGLRTG